MSLTVKDNHDGTFTVSCDGTSVTVGERTKSPPEPPPAVRFREVTDLGGGVVAHIVPGPTASPVDALFLSHTDEIVASYYSAVENQGLRQTWGNVFKVGVRANDTIDLHEISERIKESQATSGLGLELYFTQEHF